MEHGNYPMTNVSVVIPTHKRPRFLRRAIISVIGQTVIPLEIIVVENGESHEGRAVVENLQKAGHRILYLHERTPNLPLARNRGVQAAQGEWIAFLDDDDEWLPKKLERQMASFEQDPALGLVSCRARLINAQGEEIGEKPDFKGEVTFKNLVIKGCLVWSMSSVIVRKKCFDRVGDFNPAYHGLEDYDFYLRLAKAYKILTVPEVLIRYHLHAENVSQDLVRMWKGVVDILKSLPVEESLGVTREILRDVKISYGLRHYSRAITAFEAADYPRAAQHFKAAVCCDPFIGSKVPWSRFRHSWYRSIRPYLALLWCRLSAIGLMRTKHARHVLSAD